MLQEQFVTVVGKTMNASQITNPALPETVVAKRATPH